MLDVRDLHKRYGSTQAVDGVSFSVAAGTCVGLLGPNGAGKTTTVSMIAGVLAPDQGEVQIDGAPLRGDADPQKARLGLVPQELALYEELNADENLRFFGSLQGLAGAPLKRAMDDALAFVGLADRRRDRVKNYSGGMKRRLNLAAALLHEPALLILDEPTVGVDPQSRAAMFANLEALKAQGKAILYTTHYMEEAERLCDRIVIVDQGRVIADDTLRGLSERMPPRRRMSIEIASGDVDDTTPWLVALRQRPGVESVERVTRDATTTAPVTLEIRLTDLAIAAELLGWLAAQGVPVRGFQSERASLETVFLTLTGHALRDA